MKRFCALFITAIFVLGLAVSPVFAGGGKNQIAHEQDIGKGNTVADTGENPGSDFQGNQAD